MNLKTITAAALLIASAGDAYAKVSPQQASELGNKLTSMGAQMSGNASGSIPTFSGGLKIDESVDPFLDIYADEKPLFVITAENLAQHKKNLSDGQLAMFEKYPASYKMPVYQTHRTAAYSQKVHEKAQKNVSQTTLVSDGNGLSHFDETVPFAIPQNGVEVIWNHISRYRGGSLMRNTATVNVQRNGDFTPIKLRSTFSRPEYLLDGYDAKRDDNILFYFLQSIKSPARYTGNLYLVHETIDQVSQPRMAWTYNSGQRRVRRAPQVAYDAPGQASDGLRTVDQGDMFNGAPDRYNWKLIGKKEVYIPYNSYKLASRDAKYKDIVQPNHINQDLTRYELHRVWQVEATLKEGARHLYNKRTFYVDEDSWQIALADHYDDRGELWRTAEGHALQFTNVGANWYVGLTYYDLFSGRYLADLNNEERDAYIFNQQFERKNFTATALRRKGKR